MLLPELSLVTDVHAISGAVISLTELRSEIQRLEGLRQVVSVRDEDGVLRYRITDDGRAARAAFP